MDFDLELIGAWSTSAFYDETGQSDEIVAFKNDGTGWIAVSKHGLGRVDWFEWSPTSPGWVILWGTRSFELLSGGRSREVENEMEKWLSSNPYLHFDFTVTLEIAPNEREMKVLRIEILPFGDNVFGLIEADSSKLQAPFSNT